MYHTIFTLNDLGYINDDGIPCVEKWLPVKEWEEFYQVSDLGRVKSLGRECDSGRLFPTKILKQRFNKSGYLVVSLRKPRRPCYIPYVHKLVLIAFKSNPLKKPEGNHKKGKKSDNRLSELEWVTKSENILHSFKVLGKKGGCKSMKGSTNPNAKTLKCLNDGKIFYSVTEAADYYGFKRNSVYAAVRGEIYSLFGHIFEYTKHHDTKSLQ
jgi:NUMOD4 motif